MTARPPRPIDHCVLPVEGLDIARRRLAAIGFTVAPRADHPFGTSNACVYCSDDSYLEPLAVTDAELAAKTALKRNVFAVRDAAFRIRNGENGFSALVFGTDNANADHRRFVFAGISAGRQLAFSRPFEAPDGSVSEASFRLAFAADPRSPDAFFFSCERVKRPEADKSDLIRHANGVSGILQVVMSEPHPADFLHFCQLIARNRRAETHAHGIEVETANGSISVLDPAGCKVQFGIDTGKERGLRLRAIVFRTNSLPAVLECLASAGIDHETRQGRVVVPPAPGQGAVFAFEERQQ